MQKSLKVIHRRPSTRVKGVFTPLDFESLILHPSSFFKIRLITPLECIEPLILPQYKVKSLGVLVLTIVYNLPFILLPAPGCIYIFERFSWSWRPYQNTLEGLQEGIVVTYIIYHSIYITLMYKHADKHTLIRIGKRLHPKLITSRKQRGE